MKVVASGRRVQLTLPDDMFPALCKFAAYVLMLGHVEPSVLQVFVGSDVLQSLSSFVTGVKY